MHKIVIGLEKKGFVDRKSDPSHGRKIKTLLTPDGEKKLRHAHKIVSKIEVEMTKNLSKEEVDQTIKNLEKCINSLEVS